MKLLTTSVLLIAMCAPSLPQAPRIAICNALIGCAYPTETRATHLNSSWTVCTGLLIVLSLRRVGGNNNPAVPA